MEYFIVSFFVNENQVEPHCNNNVIYVNRWFPTVPMDEFNQIMMSDSVKC